MPNRTILRRLLLTAAVAISSSALASEQMRLSANEQTIIQRVDALIPQAKQDLKTVVNINSGTMNFDGVKQVGLFFKQQLDELGFKTQWLDGKEFNRAGHLVAQHRGKQAKNSKKLLLIGHLDTVFAKDDDFQTFELLDKRYAKGPGTTDMKGGDVIMITALKALKASGHLDRLNVKLIMTGDEEHSGRPLALSKRAIIEGAKWADIALGFEDGDSKVETSVIARRGSVSWQLNVSGKPAHSSQIFQPQIGDGAIFEAARILNEFRMALSQESNLTFNPGILVAGTRANIDDSNGSAFGKGNVIPQVALIKGDIRAISPKQLAMAKNKMVEITNQSLPHTNASITFDEGYPPMPPSNGNRNLLSLYSQVSQDLGYGEVIAVDPRRAGAADISFAANHVDMALDGLGLMGDGGHTKDEVADLKTLKQNARKAALLIFRLSQHR